MNPTNNFIPSLMYNGEWYVPLSDKIKELEKKGTDITRLYQANYTLQGQLTELQGRNKELEKLHANQTATIMEMQQKESDLDEYNQRLIAANLSLKDKVIRLQKEKEALLKSHNIQAHEALYKKTEETIQKLERTNERIWEAHKTAYRSAVAELANILSTQVETTYISRYTAAQINRKFRKVLLGDSE